MLLWLCVYLIPGYFLIAYNFQNTHLRRISCINSLPVHTNELPWCFFMTIFRFGVQLKIHPFFNQYYRILSGILAGQRPILLPLVVALAISSTVLFDDTSWRSVTGGVPLVKLGLFSSLRGSKSVTACSSIFCPLRGSTKCLHWTSLSL